MISEREVRITEISRAARRLKSLFRYAHVCMPPDEAYNAYMRDVEERASREHYRNTGKSSAERR